MPRFEHECAVKPVATGTAANSLAMSVVCQPYSAIFCHAGAHIFVDEAGAPEFFTNGAKLVTIAGEDAKFSAAALEAAVDGATIYGDYGGVPAAVSVTQVNEAGLLCAPRHVFFLSRMPPIGAATRGTRSPHGSAPCRESDSPWCERLEAMAVFCFLFLLLRTPANARISVLLRPAAARSHPSELGGHACCVVHPAAAGAKGPAASYRAPRPGV